jgi:hypothetical protein
MAAAPNGDVYAAVLNGDIYKQTGGTGNFVALGQTSRRWDAMAAAPNGDVYAGIQGGVYKQTGGIGNFISLDQPIAGLYGMAAAPNGDVYAAANGGDIYKMPAVRTTGPITRIFTTAVATVRNFLTEAGHNNWILVAQGVVVDLTNAIYSTATNFFKALAGGSFISNPTLFGGVHVTPIISIATSTTIAYTGSPTTKTTKWVPTINWDTATLCQYSYDNFATLTTVTCSNNGSDIPKPTAGSHTLYLRGTDSHGGIGETAPLTFFYDNTTPTYTSCNTDLLDEATRPYYYLQSNISGNCTATVNTELRGASTTATTYTVSGNVQTTSTNANAFNITLRNITVTGTVTAEGGATGKNGGNINIYNSTVGPVLASGGTNASGNGGNAGVITVDTSTTGYILANGGSGSANGGNAATTTITNSLGSPLTSTISANGGNSTSCGNGGNSGIVSLTTSSYGIITTDPGAGLSLGCPTESHPSGQRHVAAIVGTHTSQNSASSPSTNAYSPERIAYTTGGLIQTITLPINVLPKLNLQTLPTFGGTSTDSFSFITPIQNFLFATSTPSLLTTLLQSLGITTKQAIASLNINPIRLTNTNIQGLFTVKGILTKLTGDKDINIYQKITTLPNTTLTISLIPTDNKLITGTFNNQPITFNPDNTITIKTPSTLGTYFLKTSSSPIPLAIEVTAKAPTLEPTPETKPPTLWSRVVKWFSRK